MKTMLLLIVSLLLSGCGTVYRTQFEPYCPAIRTYSPEFLNELADQIESLPPNHRAIEAAIKNYTHLRDRIRRCHQEKDKI